MSETTLSTRRYKLALAAGYMALAGATLSAVAAPAPAIEPSIYEGTPLAVWVLLGVALTVSLLCATSALGTVFGRLALVLGGGSTTVIVALPLVRGYRFGRSTGTLVYMGSEPVGEVFDPAALPTVGLRTTSALLAELGGIGPARAASVLVCAIAVCYLVFVPLCIAAITGRAEATAIGTFVGFCLLPINHIGTHYLLPHGATEAILLSPVVFYVLIQYLLDTPSSRAGLAGLSKRPTRVGIVLALGVVAFVCYSPRQAGPLFAVFVAIAGVQFVCRRHRYGGEIRAHHPLYGPTVWLALLACGPWLISRGLVGGIVSTTTGRLPARDDTLDIAASIPARPGRVTTLLDPGSSELFAKLLLVPSLFAVLAAGVVFVSLLGRSETIEPETTALLRSLSAGLFALLPCSALGFAISGPPGLFGVLGFAMVFVSILGAIGLSRLGGVLTIRFSPALGYRATTLFLAAMLVFSVVAVFPSPYLTDDTGSAIMTEEYRRLQTGGPDSSPTEPAVRPSITDYPAELAAGIPPPESRSLDSNPLRSIAFSGVLCIEPLSQSHRHAPYTNGISTRPRTGPTKPI
jgi:hypothetical protein